MKQGIRISFALCTLVVAWSCCAVALAANGIPAAKPATSASQFTFPARIWIAGVRIFVCTERQDMRRSFDHLVAIAREQLGLDVMRSAVVLYFSRDLLRCKLLFHDGSGLVILYKRLDAGRFHLPAAVLAGDRSVRIDPRELALVLAGRRRLLTTRLLRYTVLHLTRGKHCKVKRPRQCEGVGGNLWRDGRLKSHFGMIPVLAHLECIVTLAHQHLE